MTPKVTYLVNGATEEIVFSPDDHLAFLQDWERDEVEYKNPFTGEKTRRLRGYYYKATIAFDAATYDLLDTFRDLFNVATSNLRFYPDKDQSEFFEVDANESIATEDAHAVLAVRGFEIVFRSKKRFDSALNYPSAYWGARRLIFSDNPTMETHRSELQTEDDANLADTNAAASDVASHVQGSGLLHSAVHYMKSEVDALVAVDKKLLYQFALRITSLNDAPAQYQDPVVYQSVRMLGFKSESAVGTVATVRRDGALKKIGIAWEGTPTTHIVQTVDIAVVAGQRLEVRLEIDLMVDVGWVHKVKVFVDGAQVSTYSIGTDLDYPFNASVVILEE